MRIELKQTEDQTQLLKALGSRDLAVSHEANAALSTVIGPILEQVIQQVSTASVIYRDLPFNQDETPSLLLDLFYDKQVDYISTWSQQTAGGLPTNEIEGGKEAKIATYKIHSAVAFEKKFARRARYDILNQALLKMSQEILVHQEQNAWAVAFSSVAGATSTHADHIISATTAGKLQLDDVNRLMIQARRSNMSFANGTSINMGARRLTDLVLSPERMGDIRSWVYNPVNTTSIPNTDESANIALPDAMRQQIYNSVGLAELFGVNLIELAEFGISSQYGTEKYNTLFDTLYSGSSPTFSSATQELALGLDLSSDSFFRPVERGGDNGGTIATMPDDQFVSREDRTGFWSEVIEGRICINERACFALII